LRPAAGISTSRVARGVLDLVWPGGFDPLWMAEIIKFRQKDNPLHIERLGAATDISAARPMLTRAVSFMLVCAMRKHPESERLLREANFRDPIARAVQLMEIHPYRNWTVSDLAMKVGLGRSTFASRFHAERGKPPIEVLTDIRMELARKLVMESDLKISDVAERVGYHSSSAFIRRFMNHFEISPGTMRSDHQRQ
jgi:transcriptional regulator GlxA family with amidase domain